MLVLQQYSIADFKDEIRAMVARGSVSRQQRIYELRRHFGDSAWYNFEQLLNLHEYLLKDYVIDLVGVESWVND